MQIVQQTSVDSTENGATIEENAGKSIEHGDMNTKEQVENNRIAKALQKAMQIHRKLEKKEMICHRVFRKGFFPKRRSQKYAIRNLIKFEKVNFNTSLDEELEDESEWEDYDSEEDQDEDLIVSVVKKEEPVKKLTLTQMIIEDDPEIGDIDGWMREAKANFERCKFEYRHFYVKCDC